MSPRAAARLREIVRERRGVSAETAIALGAYFRQSPEFWMNAQKTYDLSKELIENGRQEEECTMPDDKTKKIPQDRGRINLNQRYEVRDWCKKFDCTEDELRQAVDAVGDSADAVKDWLSSS